FQFHPAHRPPKGLAAAAPAAAPVCWARAARAFRAAASRSALSPRAAAAATALLARSRATRIASASDPPHIASRAPYPPPRLENAAWQKRRAAPKSAAPPAASPIHARARDSLSTAKGRVGLKPAQDQSEIG